MEKKALSQFKAALPDLTFTEAEGYMDEELRIDILFGNNKMMLGGIQIKPLTFMKMRAEVITYNRVANKNWGRPVYYLYYVENEKFINLKDLVGQLEDQGSKNS